MLKHIMFFMNISLGNPWNINSLNSRNCPKVKIRAIWKILVLTASSGVYNPIYVCFNRYLVKNNKIHFAFIWQANICFVNFSIFSINLLFNLYCFTVIFPLSSNFVVKWRNMIQICCNKKQLKKSKVVFPA